MMTEYKHNNEERTTKISKHCGQEFVLLIKNENLMFIYRQHNSPDLFQSYFMKKPLKTWLENRPCILAMTS